MEPCALCESLHGKPFDTLPHTSLAQLSRGGIGVPPNIQCSFVRWGCNDCKRHMIQRSEGHDGLNRWSIADFPQSVDFEAHGCHFWADARQQPDGRFRGGVHVIGIDDTPVYPPLYIPAPTTKEAVDDAQEDGEAFGFSIAKSGLMRMQALARIGVK